MSKLTNLPVQLILLQCPKCQTAVATQPGEVAWVCETCGQGLLLDEVLGAKLIDVFFSAQIPINQSGRPYWVSLGTVSAMIRETYKGDERKAMTEYWSNGRLFFIPAWNLAVEQVVNEGVRLLSQPVTMNPGGRTRFNPVTVTPRDVQALAEFMVMSVEAARKDALRHLDFIIKLEPPQLWILP
jgi:hypothetical protein